MIYQNTSNGLTIEDFGSASFDGKILALIRIGNVPLGFVERIGSEFVLEVPSKEVRRDFGTMDELVDFVTKEYA